MSRNNQDKGSPCSHRLSSLFVVCFATATSITILFGGAWAHEGHQPLPTKGVQLDRHAGSVVLSAQASSLLGLETVPLERRTADDVSVAYAEVHSSWERRAFASARLAGTISALHCRPGESVMAGQILADLTSGALEQLRSEWLASEQELQNARSVLEVTLPAARTGAIPFQRLLEAENALQQAENRRELAIIRAKSLGVDDRAFSMTSEDWSFPVRAPIDGVIIHADLAVGKFVTPSEHLFDIADNSEVWIQLHLLESDASKISVGCAVDVRMDGLDQEVHGKVDWLDRRLDPKTLQRTAWVRWQNRPNEPVLRPGMRGTSRLTIQSIAETLVVPVSAIFSDGLQRFVFLQESFTQKGGEYRKKVVQVLHGKQVSTPSDHDIVPIQSDSLFPGDKVVTRGGHELSSLFFLEALRLSPQAEAQIGLKTVEAGSGSIHSIQRLDAQIMIPPNRKTTVASRLEGMVKSIQLVPGGAVKKGDLLLEIVSPHAQDLQLQLLQTDQDWKLWRDSAQRLSSVGQDAVAKKNILEATNKSKQFELQSTNLRGQLRSLGMTSDMLNAITEKRTIRETIPVYASADGYVTDFGTILGKWVQADEPLAELQSLEELWVEAFSPPTLTASPERDSVVTVQLVSNSEITFDATVESQSPVQEVGARTRSIWLKPSSKPEGGLMDGMFATAFFRGPSRPVAIRIPQSAIVRDGAVHFVFVREGFGHIRRRRVNMGEADEQHVEILSGLHSGERVIVSGVRELQIAFSSVR